MDILALIISIVLDIIFYKEVILSTGDVMAILMATIFGMPAVACIMYGISCIISPILSLLLSILTLGFINIDNSKENKPKDDNYIDRALVARCDTLIEVCETLKGTEIEFDSEFRSLLLDIKMFKYTDQYKAGIACDSLDRLLSSTEYKTTVARTNIGYKYLRSIRAI